MLLQVKPVHLAQEVDPHKQEQELHQVLRHQEQNLLHLALTPQLRVQVLLPPELQVLALNQERDMVRLIQQTLVHLPENQKLANPANLVQEVQPVDLPQGQEVLLADLQDLALQVQAEAELHLAAEALEAEPHQDPELHQEPELHRDLELQHLVLVNNI